MASPPSFHNRIIFHALYKSCCAEHLRDRIATIVPVLDSLYSQYWYEIFWLAGYVNPFQPIPKSVTWDFLDWDNPPPANAVLFDWKLDPDHNNRCDGRCYFCKEQWYAIYTSRKNCLLCFCEKVTRIKKFDLIEEDHEHKLKVILQYAKKRKLYELIYPAH